MRNIPLSENEYYHVCNRGVDKRTIFIDKKDYQRFFDTLDELNTSDVVGNRKTQSIEALASHKLKPLVSIVSYSLMPNHFHILIQQLTKHGCSEFMHKLQMSYTKYFNTKYDRSGALFQGSFRAKRIDTNEYLLQASRYIHLNHLDLTMPRWKETGFPNPTLAQKILKEYPWSSYRYYVDNKFSCPFPLQMEIIKDQFVRPIDFIRFTFSSTAGQQFDKYNAFFK